MIVLYILPIILSVVKSLPASEGLESKEIEIEAEILLEVERLPNGCPVNSDVHQLLPHETNCSHFYYCVFGQKLERQCPPETLFNSIIQVCVSPDLADCSTTLLDVENHDRKKRQITDSYGTNLEKIETLEVERLPNGCPVNSDVHQLLPHETNCSHFYYCLFGKKVERQCPPETLFNSIIQVCVSPVLADCPTTLLDIEDHERKKRQITDPYGTTTEKIETLPNGCPSNWSIHHLLPHETNCSQFYYCDNGLKLATPHNCSIGTVFSYKYQVCVWPYQDLEACADGGNTPSGNEHTNSSTEDPNLSTVNPNSSTNNPNPNPSTEESNSSTTDYPIGTTTEQIETLPNGCPTNWSIPHLLPHETNCSLFYYCENGLKLPTPHNCSIGTVFSYKYQVCVWPFQATENCTNGEINPTTVDPTTPTGDPTTPTSDPNTPTSDPTTPTSDPNTPTSDPITPTSDPTTPTSDPNTPTSDPITPTSDPTTPTSDPNTPTSDPTTPTSDLTTPTSDPNTPTSDSTTPTSDPNTPTGDPTTPTSDPTTPTSDPNTPTGDPNNSTIDPTTSPSTEEPNDNICTQACNVLPWAHNDCDKYWTCNGDQLVLGICSLGLHFNNATATCDYVCNAACMPAK